MINIPDLKIGIVAVSRDCFPASLAVNRRKALIDAYKKNFDEKDIYECPVCIIESEIQAMEALEDIKKAGCNALCVYLGNFGKFQRLLSLRSLTDLLCSAQLLRSHRTTLSTEEEMLTAECSMQATTSTFVV